MPPKLESLEFILDWDTWTILVIMILYNLENWFVLS